MNRLSISTFAITAAMLTAAPAPAQNAAPPKNEAAAIVDGATREIFQSTGRDRAGYIVQIDVTRSELGPAATRETRAPAPGETVYVHADQNALPRERSAIRAYLRPRAGGGWEGTPGGWFTGESTEPTIPPIDPGAPSETPPAAAPAGDITQRLGLEVERLETNGRLVLKVASVAPDSPAQKAGLEKGDIIIGANNQGFSNLQEFADILAKSGESAELNVLDSRSGRQAKVPIALGGAPTTPAPTPDPSPAPARGGLGLSTAAGTVDLLPVVKVTKVAPGSPADKAGIEVGDAIVAVNDAVVFAPDLFDKAVKSAGASFTLTVLDVKTGKRTPVKIDMGR